MSDVDGSGVFYEQAWIIHAGVSRSVGRFDDAGAVDAKYSPTAGMFVVHRWSDGLPSGYDVLWPDGTLKAVIPEVSAR
jgi:hypothetical protein